MSDDGWPELTDADLAAAGRRAARRERRAPICSWCGVTALPGHAAGSAADFVCDNADCPGFGEPIG